MVTDKFGNFDVDPISNKKCNHCLMQLWKTYLKSRRRRNYKNCKNEKA
jgi:hypothetical protein